MTTKNKFVQIQISGRTLIVITVPKQFKKFWVYWDGTSETLRVANDGSWISWFHELKSESGNPKTFNIIGLVHELKDSDLKGFFRGFENPKKALDDILLDNGFQYFNTDRNILLIEDLSKRTNWLEELKNHLDSLSESEKEKLREEFNSDFSEIRKGWVDIESHLPMMLAKDIVQGYSVYEVMNKDGEVFETVVSDHNTWYHQAKNQGITHWLNK